MPDEDPMPKIMYVVDEGNDYTYMAAHLIGNVVNKTDGPTVVGVYRLVETRKYVACNSVRRVDPPKKAKP